MKFRAILSPEYKGIGKHLRGQLLGGVHGRPWGPWPRRESTSKNPLEIGAVLPRAVFPRLWLPRNDMIYNI